MKLSKTMTDISVVLQHYDVTYSKSQEHLKGNVISVDSRLREIIFGVIRKALITFALYFISQLELPPSSGLNSWDFLVCEPRLGWKQ